MTWAINREMARRMNVHSKVLPATRFAMDNESYRATYAATPSDENSSTFYGVYVAVIDAVFDEKGVRPK